MFAKACLLLATLQLYGAVAIAGAFHRPVLVRGVVCDRESGRMAFRIAAGQGADAERLLERIKDLHRFGERLAAFSFAWHFGVRPEIRVAAEARNFNLFWLPGEPDNAFQSEF